MVNVRAADANRRTRVVKPGEWKSGGEDDPAAFTSGSGMGSGCESPSATFRSHLRLVVRRAEGFPAET